MHPRLLAEKLLEWVREDSPHGDPTTETLVPRGTLLKAVVRANEPGVAACTEDIAEALHHLGVRARALKASGEEFRKGDTLLEVEGDAHTLLLVERTLLNLLSLLSGIATATRAFAEKARRVNTRVRVAATRKTPPGLLHLAKKAVKAGGGDTHRFSLSDAVLIKDNHLAVVGNVGKAVEMARRASSFIHRVEVEVETVEDAVEAARAGADVVMLDNMTPSQVREAIRRLEEEGLRGKVLVEVSGGVNLDNVEEYAAAGPDVISTSSITMRARPVDLTMEVVEVRKP